jgi:hypothetical protein
MKTPAEIYRASKRVFEGTPEDIDYGGAQSRRVNDTTGVIRYGNELIFISNALGGWSVGLKPCVDGKVEVWFSRLLLGHIDPATFSFQAVLGQPESWPPPGQNV